MVLLAFQMESSYMGETYITIELNIDLKMSILIAGNKSLITLFL